jgi:hypothetical protein
MAEQLTLEALGVDLAALAKRIRDAQSASGRDDETCARLAGVTVERWRSWKENAERPGVAPGVARLPKIADACASTPPALMFGVGISSRDGLEDVTAQADRAAQLVGLLVPHVRAVLSVARIIEKDSVPVPGGAEIAAAMREMAEVLDNSAAIPAWRIPDDVELFGRGPEWKSILGSEP